MWLTEEWYETALIPLTVVIVFVSLAPFFVNPEQHTFFFIPFPFFVYTCFLSTSDTRSLCNCFHKIPFTVYALVHHFILPYPQLTHFTTHFSVLFLFRIWFQPVWQVHVNSFSLSECKPLIPHPLLFLPVSLFPQSTQNSLQHFLRCPKQPKTSWRSVMWTRWAAKTLTWRMTHLHML